MHAYIDNSTGHVHKNTYDVLLHKCSYSHYNSQVCYHPIYTEVDNSELTKHSQRDELLLVDKIDAEGKKNVYY